MAEHDDYAIVAHPDLLDHIPEIDFDITTTEIVAKPRRLKWKWSTSSTEDFKRDFGTFRRFEPGTYVCKIDNMRIYGEVKMMTVRGDVLVVTPKTGKRRVIFADDLRKLNLLEVIALESV